MALKLSNNADGLLAMAISNSATSLTLEAGHGSRFPALGSGDWFPITVVRASDPSQFEIMRCTGRSGDTLTVVRAQEGTSAITFNAGDVVSLRLTSGTLEENFPQVEGRNAKNLRFSIASVGGKPELKFKSGGGEETVVRQSDIEDVVRQSDIEDVVRQSDFSNLHPATQIMWDSPAGDRLGIVTQNSAGRSNIFFGEYLRNGILVYGNSDASSPKTILVFANGVGQAKIVNGGVVIGPSTAPTLGNGTLNAINGLYDSGERVYSPVNDAHLVKTSRTISTGTGLTGGGNLSANRTISLASSHIPIGVGQTWRDVTSSRSSSTIYTNTVGRPIYVAIHLGAGGIAEVSEDGTNWVSVGNAGTTSSSCSFIVPAGYRYRYRTTNLSFVYWAELR